MGHDRKTAARAVSVTLDKDLVRQASLYTSDLGGTLEELLAEFVVRERARRQDEDAALGRVVDALDAFHAKHGLLSDEFAAL